MLPVLSNRWTSRSPFWTLNRLHGEMDRLMSDLYRTTPSGVWDEPTLGRGSVWSLPVDVMETDTEYRYVFEVPGFQLADLDVTVENNVLRVTGERNYPYGREGEDEADVRQFERRFGRFERSFVLPQNVDVDHISATCEHGILTVSVPKTETARPRRIEIGSGSGLGQITEAASA